MKHQQREYQESLDRLVDILNTVVQEQVGRSLAETMRRIRRLALERRAGIPDAEPRLRAELKRLDLPQVRSVIRWLSLFFDLANTVEDLQRIHVLKQRGERARETGTPRAESIAAAVFELKDAGRTPADVQQWLNRLRVEPVFTAHPSEAKRRTTRQLLGSIREQLPGLMEADSAQVEKRLLADMTVLWQSDLVRPQRPTVMSEVSRGVFFAATLWDIVPNIYREMRDALADAYPHHRFEVPCFIRFGTWIGGDRDGHPFVTADVTRKALARLKRAGLENHLAECRGMLRRLVVSDQQVPSDESLKQRTNLAAKQWQEFAERLEPFSEWETYRRFLKLTEYRLEHSLAHLDGEAGTPARYASAEEFRTDLVSMKQSVCSNRGQRIAEELIQPWLDRFDTFGFHFAALDVRQNSQVHRECFEEILGQFGIADETDANERWAAAFALFDAPFSIDLDRLSPPSREAVETVLLLADEITEWGVHPIGGYVISMTHSPADVLTVLWLWKAACRMRNKLSSLPALSIIPLFETIDDLRSAGDIVQDLFRIPEYMDYVTNHAAGRQTVMVGYSDSTKDGGYLSACWELHQAQARLSDIANRSHVELTVFHGRGGALGRGGGPAARAIRSLPAKAVDGRLRFTEQGEVLAERYDDPRIAHRHLEQVINATLLVSAQQHDHPKPEWLDAMARMSATSLTKYRNLVRHSGFLAYFDEGTPIGAIETLLIGSRPARRARRKSLGDLRAIPWTFAWTQSRHLLPAWFGFGTAVRNYIEEHDESWSRLRAMYDRWPMFRALVDNAELALAKADMEIAHEYAKLSHVSAAEEIWEQISTEFDWSRGAVLMITTRHELLGGTEWLRRSIQNRNPYVDPLNLAQIELLERQRSRKDDQLKDLLRLSIQGIASGLRTTG